MTSEKSEEITVENDMDRVLEKEDMVGGREKVAGTSQFASRSPFAPRKEQDLSAKE